MISPNVPALVLAPMEGVTDAPVRALLGANGAFTYAVSEFVRVSAGALPAKVFRRSVPELLSGAKTPSGLPVQVQILGGNPELVAETAVNAWKVGATCIDLNFGCPAPLVNTHDGGASLLRHPCRLRDIVAAVKAAVPVPVSAKLRLGWDNINAIHENAAMAAEGGASWLTIHARTKVQGYAPPVYWQPIGKVREDLGLPVIANGDIWTLADFRRCREETGCIHYMLGRSALADPSLSFAVARELGISTLPVPSVDWLALMRGHVHWSQHYGYGVPRLMLLRLKQWLAMASKFGNCPYFDALKRTQTIDEFFSRLEELVGEPALC